MPRTFFSPAAEKDFGKLSGAAEKEVKKRLTELANDPHSGKLLHGPLRGFFVLRFHAGGVAYRIVYEIVGADVLVLMIGSRDNFYKKLNRRVR